MKTVKHGEIKNLKDQIEQFLKLNVSILACLWHLRILSFAIVT